MEKPVFKHRAYIVALLRLERLTDVHESFRPIVSRIGIFSSPASGLSCLDEIPFDFPCPPFEGNTYDEARKKAEEFTRIYLSQLKDSICPKDHHEFMKRFYVDRPEYREDTTWNLCRK